MGAPERHPLRADPVRRPGRPEEWRLDDLGLTPFQHLTLRLCRWHFHAFNAPESQGWLRALQLATGEVGAVQAGALCYDVVALVEALRAVRRSTFASTPRPAPAAGAGQPRTNVACWRFWARWPGGRRGGRRPRRNSCRTAPRTPILLRPRAVIRRGTAWACRRSRWPDPPSATRSCRRVRSSRASLPWRGLFYRYSSSFR